MVPYLEFALYAWPLVVTHHAEPCFFLFLIIKKKKHPIPVKAVMFFSDFFSRKKNVNTIAMGWNRELFTNNVLLSDVLFVVKI